MRCDELCCSTGLVKTHHPIVLYIVKSGEPTTGAFASRAYKITKIRVFMQVQPAFHFFYETEHNRMMDFCGYFAQAR